MTSRSPEDSSLRGQDLLLAALCAVRTPSEARSLVADLLSQREASELAQRLEVASMLRAGSSYVDVSRATGASSTTVSRVSKCLNGAEGGYRLVFERMESES